VNWDAIGAVGESLAALAVVISLTYMAMQIRQNTRALRYSARQSQAQDYSSFIDLVLANPELTRLHAAICPTPGLSTPNDLELTPDEHATASRLLYRAMVVFGSEYDAWRTGLIPDEMWMEANALIAAYLRSPISREYWNNLGLRSLFNRSFAEYIDTQMGSSARDA
jgi:hypothetical protein